MHCRKLQTHNLSLHPTLSLSFSPTLSLSLSSLSLSLSLSPSDNPYSLHRMFALVPKCSLIMYGPHIQEGSRCHTVMNHGVIHPNIRRLYTIKNHDITHSIFAMSHSQQDITHSRFTVSYIHIFTMCHPTFLLL